MHAACRASRVVPARASYSQIRACDGLVLASTNLPTPRAKTPPNQTARQRQLGIHAIPRRVGEAVRRSLTLRLALPTRGPETTHDGGGASSYLTRVWHLATGVQTCTSSPATTSKSGGGGASCKQPRAVAAPPRYKSANGRPPSSPITDHRYATALSARARQFLTTLTQRFSNNKQASYGLRL